MAKKHENNLTDVEKQLTAVEDEEASDSDDEEASESDDEEASESDDEEASESDDEEASESDDEEESANGDAAEQDEASSSEAEDEESDLDLAASNTESDEDDSDSVQEDSASTKTRAKIEEEKMYKKYQERQGKQLYVRFPKKLPEDEDEFQRKVGSLSTLIVRAHKPRQKYAHFCLVDFNCKTDRDTAMEAIKKAKETDEALKKVFVAIPRTEKADFVKELVERKLKSLENKKAKQRLKRQSQKAINAKKFTSSIVVLNIPSTASMLEVRKLFPNAVDVQMKPAKGKRHGSGLATITLPSTMDARAAVKQKLSLNGVKLMVRYDRQTLKKLQPWTPEANRIAVKAKKKKFPKITQKSKKSSKQETEFKTAQKPTKNKTVAPKAAPTTKQLKRVATVDAVVTGPHAKLKRTAIANTTEKGKKNLKLNNKVDKNKISF